MVIEAVTGIFGGKKAKKAAKKQKALAMQIQKEARIQSALAKEQFETEKVLVNEQRRQDRISTLREARIRRAALLSSAKASGAGMGSSSIQGGVSSLQSAFSNAIGLSNVFTGIQEKSSDIQSRLMTSQGKVAQLQGQSDIVAANLQKSMANIQMWGSVAQLGTDLATAAFPKTRGTSFGSSQFFTQLFGGGPTTGVGVNK